MFQKILVIDDTPAMAQLAETVLARQYPGASVDVLFAQRGLDAFARMHVAQPDLILLSDSLPDLRAEAVCMRLLSDHSTARIPVYLVNQTGEADLIEDLYQNVSRVLPRPVLYDTMAEIMGKVVALPRPLSPPSRNLPFYDQARAAFSGHTGFFQTQAALQMAFGDRLTGVLRFFVNRFPIELYVNRGRFVFASTRNCALYCRESPAVLDGATLGQIVEASEAQEVSGCPLFLYLGMRGLIPQEDVVPVVREHSHRLFSSLWTAGRVPFEFERMDVLPEFAEKFPASGEDADNWVLVSLRQLQTSQLPVGMRIDSNGSPVYTRKGASLIERLRLSDIESRFAARVNGAESLLSIAKRTGIEMEEAKALVFRFTTLGVMDYWTGQALPGSSPAISAQRLPHRSDVR
jgi:CheY-like chemotaxis protein